MATYDKRTGKIISGVDELFQSIETFVTTPKRSRVMRRHLGADRVAIVDRSISPLTLIDFYARIAEAVQDEPRFKLVKMSLSQDSDVPNGHAIFDVQGVFYPRGHLGDYSNPIDVSRGVAAFLAT